MTDDRIASLSDDIEDSIGVYFAPEDRTAVRAELLSYTEGVRRQAEAFKWSDADLDRVRFDLLYLASRDVGRLKRLVELAIRDFRDIVCMESFWVAGRLYPHEWARRHEVNGNSDRPPKLNQAIIATAELILRARPRELRIGRRQPLPSLNLNFSERSQLIDFANRMKSLPMPDAALDLSGDLRYVGSSVLVHHSPESTLLLCLSVGEPERLTHDGKVLSWEGDADYWTECHCKCIQLAESGDGYQDMSMGESGIQRVRVSLNLQVSRWR
jgi:hypothetical protein